MTTRTKPTPNEAIAMKALRHVICPPASWDKRFIRSLGDSISENESRQVWRLLIRYRRQIRCPRKDELIKIAEKLAAPDFRKMNAAQRDKERIDEVRRKYEAMMKPGFTCKQDYKQ